MPEIEETSSQKFLQEKGHVNPHIKGILGETL